jgi:hypothetical protein
MPKLAPNDREQILQLLDDMVVIESLFQLGAPMPAAIRAALVPLLRLWVAEGLFHRAQKLILPTEVGFPIRTYDHAIDLCERGVYVHWMSAIEFNGIAVGAGQFAPDYLGADGGLGRRRFPRPCPPKGEPVFRSEDVLLEGRILHALGCHQDARERAWRSVCSSCILRKSRCTSTRSSTISASR